MRSINCGAASVLLVVLVACGADERIAPTVWGHVAAAALATVPPASAYTVHTVPAGGWFSDVNSRNLIVGTADGNAAAMQLGGVLHKLSNGPGSSSEANAVNEPGTIVGSVNVGTQTAPQNLPAVWASPTSAPSLIKDSGAATDINDRGLIVGYLERNYATRAALWSPTGKTMLPLLPGGKQSRAFAINNDNVILGYAESGTVWQSVLWRDVGNGWVVQQLAGGIVGYDIDAGFGVVGSTGGLASFGKPDHAGFYATTGQGLSEALGVSSTGLATGHDQGASPGWPQNTIAFVADRSGTMTYLPNPPGIWRDSYGYGVNPCGLVVGTIWTFPGNQYQGAQPAVWDPGC